MAKNLEPSKERRHKLGKIEAGPDTPGSTSWNKHAASNRGWPVWKGRILFGRMTGAVMRAVLAALLIATPALMLPGLAVDSTQITVLVALIAACLTFIEYNSSFPSIVAFRDAPPFNRIRFLALFLTVFMLSAIVAGETTNSLTAGLTSMGRIVGNLMDFPFSPVRLIVLTLPQTADAEAVRELRIAAGLSYFVSLLTIGLFLVLVRLMGWPARHGAFNVWVNLPLFDPTRGGDVLHRLQRDARIYIVAGFLLPFVIPAMVNTLSDLLDPFRLDNPQTLIWTIGAWAFLPASMIMRGIAMAKVADMIQNKRRRAYADAALQAA
jgi:hypothetical protein